MRKLLELLLPVGGDGDGLSLLNPLQLPEPILLALLHQVVAIGGVQRGQHREEVLPVAGAALGIGVREVVCHLGHLDAVHVEVGDGNLVVAWRVAVAGMLGFEELLLPSQDLLQPPGVQHGVRRHVILPISSKTNGLGFIGNTTKIKKCKLHRRIYSNNKKTYSCSPK